MAGRSLIAPRSSVRSTHPTAVDDDALWRGADQLVCGVSGSFVAAELGLLDDTDRCNLLAQFDAERESISVADCRRPEMPLVYVNGGFELFSGYSREEVLGRNCRFLQGPKTSRASLEIMRDAIRTGSPCLVEIVNYRRNGEPFVNRLSLTPVMDRRGKPAFYIGLQTDVSELRRLEEKLCEHLHQVC